MKCQIEPSRLVLARRLKRMSRTTLAKQLQVSLGAVSQWEDGKKDPSARISELAAALGQSEAFFEGSPVPTTEPESISFRRRQDASREVRDSASAAIDYSAGILSPGVRSALFRIPPLNVPSFHGMSPESAAVALRHEWGLTDGPLRNVVEQLESKGVFVYWVNEPSPSLSAFCKWVDDRPYVILNTAKRDGCRSRFDACHELAHLVMHRETNFDRLADPKIVEHEADAFASAFLLPRDTFLASAPRTFDREHLLKLKRIWGVSVQAMVRRLRDLRVFSDWQYESAFRQMSMWGWRREPEPFAGAMEMSKLHWMLCDRLESLDISPKDWASSIYASWDDVKQMMPVLGIRQSSLKMPFGNDFDPVEEASNFELPFYD